MHKVDVKITYTLLIGALAMDIIASMGLVFSDWMIGCVLHSSNNFGFIWALIPLGIKKRTWSRYPSTVSEGIMVPYPQRNSRMLFYRWSGSIPQYNLKPINTKFDSSFGTGQSKYIYYRTSLSNDLMEFIFNEIRAKAQHAKDKPEDAKTISSARGEWTLANIDEPHHLTDALIKLYTVDMEYDESLLFWYFATDFLRGGEDHGENSRHHHYCKVLSRYMMYLIIKQPTLMSTVAGIGESRYLNISQEVNSLEGSFDAWMMRTDIPKGNILRVLGARRWEITSKVWVELLCYAAIECRPRNLISQVTEGGELITFIWALMTHLGLGKQYRNQ